MGWIEDYVRFTQAHEAPEHFHVWSAIAGICAAVNRRVVFWRADKDSAMRFRSFPGQMMLVTVGKSGKLRKSTQLGFIRDILMDSKAVNVFDGTITPERFLASLAESDPINDKDAILTVVGDEVSFFFGRQTYAERMIENVLELSAAKNITQYQTQGAKIKLTNACLTLIMCTTPTSLADSVPENFHHTGMSSRIIWVYGDEAREPNPMMDRPEEANSSERAKESSILRMKLIGGIKRIQQLAGEMDATDDARAWMRNWYLEYMKTPEASQEGWPSRKMEHVIRTAQALTISDNYMLEVTDKQKLIMQTEHFERGLKLIDAVMETFYKSFAEIGRHSNSERQRKIIAMFTAKANVEISTREIMQKLIHLYRDKREFRNDMDMLIEMGMIKISAMDGATGSQSYILANKPKGF